MSVDLRGIGALALVTAEFLALGWLSGVGVGQPGGPAFAASWALRLLVGAALVAVAQLILALVGIGFALIPLALALALIGALTLRRVAGGQGASCPTKQLPTSRREQVGWLVLGVVLLAAVARSLVVPESGWDAFSHWGLRAQAFAIAGTIVDAHSEHEYYPPLVPLLEAWLYLHRGTVSIDLGKALWSVVGSAFGVGLAWHLRVSLGGRGAWLGPYLAGAILLSTPALLDGFWTGQADLALTTFLSLACLAAWQWQQRPERGWLLQAIVFGAAAAMTKFEGSPRMLIVCVVVLAEGILARRPRAWQPAVGMGLAALAASLVWVAFELSHAIAANAEHVGAIQWRAIGTVLLALVAAFGGVRTGGGLVAAALTWALSARQLLAPRVRVLTLIVVAQAAATLVAFLMSAIAPELEVSTSATRLVEQFVPLALFVGAVGLARASHL